MEESSIEIDSIILWYSHSTGTFSTPSISHTQGIHGDTQGVSQEKPAILTWRQEKKRTNEANSIAKRNRAMESSNTQSTERKKNPLPRRFHWSIRDWPRAENSRRSHHQSIICRFAVVFLSSCYIHASSASRSPQMKKWKVDLETRIHHIIPA